MSDPKSTPTPSSHVRARERAKLARFIAAMLGEAAPALLRKLERTAIQAELRSAAATLGIAGERVDRMLAAYRANGVDEESSVRLMGHTVRSECPPYELEYRSSEVFQQSQTLADIAGFYRAFGFEVAGPLAEREDHFAAQWEFLAVLAVKESRARDAEEESCCTDAQRQFLSDHAAGWMPAFFSRIRRADRDSFLGRLADLAEAVLRQWCADLHVAMGPRWIELRPTSEDDSTITCGGTGTVELGPALAAAMGPRG